MAYIPVVLVIRKDNSYVQLHDSLSERGDDISIDMVIVCKLSI